MLNKRNFLLTVIVSVFQVGEYGCHSQQQNQFPFGNLGFFSPFFGQQGNYNPFNPFGSSPTAPSFQNSNPSYQSQTPNTPFVSNPFNNAPGFGWPIGNQNQNQGQPGSNPYFGNPYFPFNQNPNTNYQNQNPLSTPGQVISPQQPPKSAETAPGQLQNQYPFGFPFANPFFPQYQDPQRQPQVTNPVATQPQPAPMQPTPNQQVSPAVKPIAQNVQLPNGNGYQPSNEVSKQPDISKTAAPVESEVEHSKQDTKHPSLITQQQPPQQEPPQQEPQISPGDYRQSEQKPLELEARKEIPAKSEDGETEDEKDEDENSISEEDGVLLFD